jgi:hypothetical protein
MGHGCDHADLRHDPWGWRCLSLAEPQTLHRESGWSATGCVSTGAIPWSVGGGAGDGGRPQRWARCPSGDRLPPPCGVWPIMGAQGEAGVHEDMVRSDERPECVPPGAAPAYLRETGVRTYGRPGAYLRETGCVPTGDEFHHKSLRHNNFCIPDCTEDCTEPMVLVFDKPNNYVSLLQTKRSHREGHEARRIGA